MAPALVVAAALVAIVLFLRSDALRPRRRGLWITTIIAAAISVIGIFPFVGIPGAVLYELNSPWVRAILGEGYAELGDAAWPVAIVLTLTWPASLVVACAVANGPLRNRGRLARWAAWLLIPYLTGVGLALWANLAAR